MKKKTTGETKDLKLKLHREILRALEAPELATHAVDGAALSVGCHKWTTPSCVGTC
ncbi:MAG TPA: hypothetical protein VF173_20005 [Thermoanaerobaculia bacterium]|nr:hypothetical protein [Thermoanaerobaculia bacterium]